MPNSWDRTETEAEKRRNRYHEMKRQARARLRSAEKRRKEELEKQRASKKVPLSSDSSIPTKSGIVEQLLAFSDNVGDELMLEAVELFLVMKGYHFDET